MERILLTGKKKGTKITGKLINDQSLEEAVQQLKAIWELPFVESKVVEILNQFRKEPTKIKKKDFDIEELLRKLEPPTKNDVIEVEEVPSEVEPMKLLRTDSIPIFDDLDVATEPVRQENMSPIKYEEKPEPKKKLILKPLKALSVEPIPAEVDPAELASKDIDEVVLEEQ